LREGERKSIASDKVILVPGPKKEVRVVRDIFRMYGYEHMGVTEIVRVLTSSGVPFPIRGRKWTGSNIRWMLQNPKYVGMNVWGRTSSPLQAARTYEVPHSDWIVKDGAFEAIVDRATFDRVQRMFGRRRSKHYWYSEGQLLRKLKRLQQRKGKVTQKLIDRTPGPTACTYFSRFGSLTRSYALAGCAPALSASRRMIRWRRSDRLRRNVMRNIKDALLEHVHFVRQGGAIRKILLIDAIPVALILCRSERTPLGHRRWTLRTRSREAGLASIVCMCNKRMDSVEHIYLYSRIDKSKAYKVEFRIKEDDPFLSFGTRLKDFNELYPALKRLLVASKEKNTKTTPT
jgi:hypothetical protein